MKMSCKILSALYVLFFLFGSTVLYAQRIPSERGLWSSPRALDRSAWNVFHSAVKGEKDGIKYTPISYSVQIVDGRRYRFYCRSTVVEAPVRGSALITVFVHYGGEIELAAIQDTTKKAEDKPTESGKTFSSMTGSQGKWLTEPLHPRTGPYLQAPRKTVRRLL